jgi:hypothetical protein
MEREIRRYSPEELEAARARGESQTDWARVRAKTDAALERDIASDPEWRDIPADWYLSATLVPSRTSEPSCRSPDSRDGCRGTPPPEKQR